MSQLSSETVLIACLGTVAGVAAVTFATATAAPSSNGLRQHAPAMAARVCYVAFLAVLVKYIVDRRGGFNSDSAPNEALGNRAAFNAHPLLMSIAVLVLMSEGVMAYRAPPFRLHYGTSSTTSHAGLNSWAAILVFFGIGIAFRHHEDSAISNPSDHDAGIDHLRSTHALVGLLVLFLVLVQVIGGLLQYFNRVGKNWRSYHQFYGITLYLTATLAAQLGLFQLIKGDQTTFDFGEKELGVLTILLWCVSVGTMTQFMLQKPNIRTEGDIGPNERDTLIQG